MKEYKLGEIVTFHYGKSLPETKRVNGTFPVMSSAGITGWHNEYLVKGPGVVVGRKGSIGTVFYEKRDFFPIDTCYFLSVNDPKIIDLKFLYYLLLGSNLKDLNSDAAVPGLNREIAYSQKFLIPGLSIQNEIVKFTDTYNDLIENNNRRIAILEDMAQSIYREWFVNFRYPNHENNVGSEGKPKLIDSPLGQIPGGWKIKCLKDIGFINTGKTPSKVKEENYSSNDVPFIKTPDMHGGMFVIKTKEMLSTIGADSQKSKYIPSWAICVSCIGTAGIVALSSQKSQTNQQINTLVPEVKAHTEFMFFTLKSLKKTIENYGATGATMTNLSKGKFEALEIVFPEDSLLDDFHQLTNPIFKQIQILARKNENLKQQRDMLLPKLISGQIEL